MTESEDVSFIITIFDIFKKVKKSLSMLTRNREDIYRRKIHV